MSGWWTAVAGISGGVLALMGTILGVTLTGKSERNRQVAADRQREVEWTRDRRLDAYSSFVRSLASYFSIECSEGQHWRR